MSVKMQLMFCLETNFTPSRLLCTACQHAHPHRHYFSFDHICTICPYTTNWVKTSLNLVLMVVHYLLNRLFQVRKVVVASGLFKGPVRE